MVLGTVTQDQLGSQCPGQCCLAAGAVTLIMNCLDPDSWPGPQCCCCHHNCEHQRREKTAQASRPESVPALAAWLGVITIILALL